PTPAMARLRRRQPRIAAARYRRHGKRGTRVSLWWRTKACETWQGPLRCDEGSVLCRLIVPKLSERVCLSAPRLCYSVTNIYPIEAIGAITLWLSGTH